MIDDAIRRLDRRCNRATSGSGKCQDSKRCRGLHFDVLMVGCRVELVVMIGKRIGRWSLVVNRQS